jgi:ATP-binding cassette subfamily B protein
MSARRRQSVLVTYLRPQGTRVAVLAALLFGGIGLQLIAPLILRRFIDTAGHGDPGVTIAQLWLMAAGFIAASIVTQVVQVGATYYSEQVGWAATNRLRRDLADHALHLDMSFHTARTPGELIERVDGDVSALANFFSQFVIQIVGGGMLIVGILAILYGQDWRIGAALSVFAIVALVTLHATRDIATDQYEAERQAWADLSGFLEERISGLDDIRANGGGGYVMDRHHDLSMNLVRRGVGANRRGVLVFITTNVVFTLGFGAALAIGVWLHQNGLATTGAVFMFVQYTQMMGDPLLRIGQQLQQFQAASASLVRVRALRALEPQIRDGPGVGWRAAAPAPALQIDDVSFCYDERAPVLEHVSFALARGRSLGLLGRTGSGKTTLTRLLFRLYEPGAGAIRIDGVDIRDATLAELRGRIGLVTQEVQLFEASIRDNATLFDPAIADARVVEVLEDLGLGPWLARQPGGLDAVLAGGGGLSAGEAQLLAFARVFLKDPGLVVLDEASSRLDPVTDRLIERAMDKLLSARENGEPRTAIIIAHKLATIARTDEIVILDRGGVLEAGPRAALAGDPHSHFARLLRSGIEEVLT